MHKWSKCLSALSALSAQVLKCPRFPSTRLPSECSSVHKCSLIVRGPECFPSALNVRVPLEYLLCVPECLIRCHWNKMLNIKKMFYVCEKKQTKMVHWVLTKLTLNQSAELKSFGDWLYKFDFCIDWILFFVWVPLWETLGWYQYDLDITVERKTHPWNSF